MCYTLNADFRFLTDALGGGGPAQVFVCWSWGLDPMNKQINSFATKKRQERWGTEAQQSGKWIKTKEKWTIPV